MPFGIDDAAAIISIVAVSITLLHGCVKGFTLLSQASGYGRDIASVRLMIELEQHKLYTWAAAVGLFDDPPTLQISDSDRSIVPHVLGQLCELLSNVDRLKSRYGLQLELTKEELAEAETPHSVFGKFGLGRGEKFDSITTKVFHQRRGVWCKMRWVTFDDHRVRKLMEDVKYFNNELQGFLDTINREKTASAIDTLLRLAILHSANQRTLAFIGDGDDALAGGAVAGAARLKSKGLLLGLIHGPWVETQIADVLALSNLQLSNQERSSSRPVPDRTVDRRLAQSRLTTNLLRLPEPTRLSLARQLAYYEDRPVLIEWKSIDKTDSPVLHNRVAKVCALLNELTNLSFHSLPSRGYLKDRATGRYGYAFDLSRSTPTNSPRLPHSQTGDATENKAKPLPPLPSVTTLHELLLQPSVRPSLNFRLSQAITLIETMLQLHTAGWLHKEIRSENMLFVRSGSDIGSPLSSILHPTSECYVSGYVYARPDDPLEMTEPLASQLQADLYRHPQYLSSARATFRKSFDIFSVGCVLLELGLWSSLADIYRRWSSSSETASRNLVQTLPQARNYIEGPHSHTGIDLLKAKHCFLQHFSEPSRTPLGASPQEALEAEMGKTYAEVVMNFFLLPIRGQHVGDDAEVDDAAQPGNDMNEHESVLELEKSSLVHLRAIAACI